MSNRVLPEAGVSKEPSFLVLTDVICNKNYEGLIRGLYSDHSNHTTPALPSPLCQDDFCARKLVLNIGGRYLEEYLVDYFASCRDLVCVYTARQVYVYSPSTAQYLRFDCHTDVGPNKFRVAIAYMASIRAYKAVMLEVLPGHRDSLRGTRRNSLRFTALTVVQEDDDVDEHQPPSWELLGEHALPSLVSRNLGNLIAVNDAVYAIIGIREHLPHRPTEIVFVNRVVSLDLRQEGNNKFKIFNLPPCCDDGGGTIKPRKIFITNTLSQVKDHLCFPHTTAASTIELWLLQRGRDSWFKGYTFPFNPPIIGDCVGQLVHFPPPYPRTKTSTTPDDDDDDWAGGLFIFEYDQQLFQYDLRTKKAGCLLEDGYNKKVHVASRSRRPFPLKHGLRCPSLTSSMNDLKLDYKMPLLPPQGSKPLHSHHPSPQVSHREVKRIKLHP